MSNEYGLLGFVLFLAIVFMIAYRNKLPWVKKVDSAIVADVKKVEADIATLGKKKVANTVSVASTTSV